jgi:hypothetical protein
MASGGVAPRIFNLCKRVVSFIQTNQVLLFVICESNETPKIGLPANFVQRRSARLCNFSVSSPLRSAHALHHFTNARIPREKSLWLVRATGPDNEHVITSSVGSGTFSFWQNKSRCHV